VFPLEGLPEWLKTIAYLNPLTYGVDGLRWSLIGFSSIPITLDVAVLISVSAAMMILASYLFSKSEA